MLVFSRCVLSAMWIESMMDLPVTVAILFERTTKEFQLPWETVLVANGSCSMYHNPEDNFDHHCH